ncbi:MAG: phosphatidate cytidylyltransferase [Bdellovibrionales bacterium]|nr:phosphatidate cytidylyltransferase [Bdellovibrionales bacterium]
MSPHALWSDPVYRETAGLIIGFIALVGVCLFALRKQNPHFNAAFASVKSWFFVAPILLFVFALPSPWPLVFLVFVGIFSAKTFFQMVGIYHRSWFVWATYFFMVALGLAAYKHFGSAYDIAPMAFLGLISLIPLLRNSSTHMVQYMALSLMACIFFGWSFMHMGRLLMMDKGVYLVLYLYILTEFSESVSLSTSKLIGRIKPFSKISSRVTVEGVLLSIVFSLILAWGMRHLLPDRSEKFWIAAGLTAAIFGRFGDLILSVIRRDLGIKDTGVFIFGRGDILSRTDKLIFVGPMYYYIFLFLNRVM